jgi:hypothetical protein
MSARRQALAPGCASHCPAIPGRCDRAPHPSPLDLSLEEEPCDPTISILRGHGARDRGADPAVPPGAAVTPRPSGTRLLVAAAAGVLGCAAAPAKSVTVIGAVVAAPVLPGDPATAYFTVENATADADSLTSVSTPASAHVVLNTAHSPTTDQRKAHTR